MRLASFMTPLAEYATCGVPPESIVSFRLVIVLGVVSMDCGLLQLVPVPLYLDVFRLSLPPLLKVYAIRANPPSSVSATLS
mgnify:CR=1 FL=1